MGQGKFLNAYVKYLAKFHYIFILIWLCGAVASSFFVFDFIQNTKLSFSPPKGTDIYDATQQRSLAFPYNSEQSDISLFARIPPIALMQSAPWNLTKQQPGKFCAAKNASKAATSIADIPSVQAFFDLLELQAVKLNAGANPANYFLLNGIGARAVAANFLSPHKSMLLFPVVVPLNFGAKPARQYASHLCDYGQSIAGNVLRNTSLNLAVGGFGDDEEDYVECITSQLTMGATGVPIMEQDMVSSSQKNLGQMDAISIPVAMVIMGFAVQSLRLLIIPLICIGVTLCIAMGIMYPISKVYAVMEAAPSLMMSLCLSMSTDYCMFIVSRYCEEIRAGQRGPAAILNTLATAGHTILISGLTLCISFVALIFFPTDLLRSFGISCSITVFLALVLSLNLTPCVLLAFPGFFERAAYPLELPKCLPRWRIWEYCGFFIPVSVDGGEGGTRASQQSGGTPTRQIRRSGSEVPTLDIGENFASQTPQGANRGLGGQVITSPTNTDNNNDAGDGSHNVTNSLENPICFSSQQIGGSASQQASLPHNAVATKSNNSNNKSGRGNIDSAADEDAKHHHKDGGKSKPVLSSSTVVINTESSFDPAINPVPSSPVLDTPNWTQAITRERTAQYGRDVGDSVFFYLAPIMRFPWNLVTTLVISGIIAYIGSLVLHMKLTDNMDAFLTRGSASRRDLLLVREEYGAGAVFPYEILFVLNKNNKAGITDLVLNSSALLLSQYIVQSVATDTKSALSAFQGPMVVGGAFPSREQIWNCTVDGAEAAFDGGSDGDNKNSSSLDPLFSPYCDKNVLTMISNQTLNPEHSAALVSFTSVVDPTGNKGKEFLDTILAAVKKRPESGSAKYGDTADLLSVFVLGVGPMSENVITDVYAHFVPLSIAVVVAVVVLCGVAFRSVVVPLRTLISIGYTELFVFGMTTAVYQYGIFGFMDDAHVGEAGAVSWLSPIVAALVVVGISCDFDVLIMTRIVEFVSHEGVTTAEGTLLGLCATGKIVTSCGLIMAVAFFGLILCDQTLINELGFMLCTAALFDTFITRTLLVPATISLLGRLHWWPNRVETASFSNVFYPSDSISARASVIRNSMMGDHPGQQQQGLLHGGAAGGGGNNGGYGTSRLYDHIEKGRVNKSGQQSQLLEQQRQRLQHLFGE